MGQRVAFAAYPPETAGDAMQQPDLVVALQVSDADEAREGLDRLADLAVAGTEPGDGLGFAVTGDYALLAPTQAAADQAAAEAADGTLTEDADFAADLAAAPDGVVTAWVDMDAASKALAPVGLGPASVLGLGGGVGSLAGGATGLSGRSTYVARFDGPDVFEVTGTTTGTEPAGWATHPVEGLADLPASTVAAFGLADGDELVPKLLDAFRKALESADGMPGAPTYEDLLRDAERELGVEIPEDLAALLGDNLVLALDGSDSDTLQVGARVRTADVARAEKVLEAVGRTGFELPVVRRVGDGELVVASSGAQADRLTTSGDLGAKDGFGDALPGLADADAALWVDVKGLSALFGEGGEPDDDVDPIEGVGVTVSSPEAGATSLTFRLVAR
jgi:hypothetical protein